ncbi:MAG: class I SAM-dependent methyltransferase [Thermoplasmata archaeon]|nr:MAG: class I SAM-dependent methyltransferase [Thermoplasmata archaeon]
MTKYFEAPEWDDFWDSSKKKQRGFKRLADIFRDHFDEQYIRTLEKISPDPIGKILEVGCGTAYCSQKLSSAEVDSYAIDYSEKAKIYWRNNSVHYFIGDGFFLPFKSNSFDVVWNAGVLEHFTNPQELLREMIRVCKPGGIVCVFVPYIFDFTAHLKLYGEENIYTGRKLKHELRELQKVNVKVLYSCGAMMICGWGEKRK